MSDNAEKKVYRRKAKCVEIGESVSQIELTKFLKPTQATDKHAYLVAGVLLEEYRITRRSK
jgi:hypothetical protein